MTQSDSAVAGAGASMSASKIPSGGDGDDPDRPPGRSDLKARGEGFISDFAKCETDDDVVSRWKSCGVLYHASALLSSLDLGCTYTQLT